MSDLRSVRTASLSRPSADPAVGLVVGAVVAIPLAAGGSAQRPLAEVANRTAAAQDTVERVRIGEVWRI